MSGKLSKSDVKWYFMRNNLSLNGPNSWLSSRRRCWVSELIPDRRRTTVSSSEGCPDAHCPCLLLLGHPGIIALLISTRKLCGDQGGREATSQPVKPGQPMLRPQSQDWSAPGRLFGLPTNERAPELCTSSSSLWAGWVLAEFSPLHPPD